MRMLRVGTSHKEVSQNMCAFSLDFIYIMEGPGCLTPSLKDTSETKEKAPPFIFPHQVPTRPQ